MLGSSEEYDDYARWVRSRSYRIELTALILATTPATSDYETAGLIVDMLTRPLATDG